ncbi:Fibronectin type 3 and ankyrin repeat domains protein 1 [Boothiomyces macroporosus]|uniref:Fibronectin type 3 and ankyrin repeat domains protein 1 n=1 Tax=Boothiomyces macroporosus TaxID=261099 RepID=A0AAD5UHA0_9FUNG|nr:Fibronectin type 3 and ankyrin repeat domains protein 1 [Boothiomyces macroporosus]
MSYEGNSRLSSANTAKKHPALPGKFPQLEVVSVEARSIHLRWFISPLYEEFLFQITKEELDILDFETVYEGEGPECEIGGLKPQTKYQFKLRYQSPADRNIGIWGSDYSEINVTTPDESAVVKASNNFMRAVTDNEPGKVKKILEEFGKQISLEARDKNGRTLLMIAAQNDSVDIIKQLLSGGADPHASTLVGKTALSFAIAYGNKAAFETLLSFDKTLLDCTDSTGSTLLMWAAESAPQAARKGSASDIIKILLSYNVDVNKEDSRGYTALDRLCMTSGSAEAAVTLIKAGARIIQHCDKKHPLTSLMTAAMNGHTELCKELIETFGVDRSVKSEVTIP